MKKGFLSVYEKGFPFSALFMYEKKRRKRKTILAHMRWRTALIVREVEEEVIFTDFFLFFLVFRLICAGALH